MLKCLAWGEIFILEEAGAAVKTPIRRGGRCRVWIYDDSAPPTKDSRNNNLRIAD